MLRLAALGFLVAPALARTNLAGCVSTDSVATPTNGGTPYATVMWYVPDTGEVCELLDCGGGRAPPKTTVPGCPQYKGSATYSPSFMSVGGAQMTSKTELPPIAASASSASSSAAAAISAEASASSSMASVVASVSSEIVSAMANMTSAIGALSTAAARNATTSAPLTSSTSTEEDDESTSVATATSTRLSSASVTRASSSSSATPSQGAASGINAGLGGVLLVAGAVAAHLF
ncbi:hypothetical protein CDD81_1799 [Ophiocordyceps australis]|uniref:Siderophore biosynthesis enzyme n=1 Tax=Ophiocordyceps australis TaxID=1399860 RepID=A0A2C5Y0F8_9HYPO|nr:hypothetical protein CDD81_1799 [Ophiocordyceps australis]